MKEELEKREGMNIVRLQSLNKGYGTCYRCGLPWNQCKSKIIMSGVGIGIFAMCQFCWDQSNLNERLHHFKTLWYVHKNRWNENYDWSIVENNIIKKSII